jgi:hypothetical protein
VSETVGLEKEEREGVQEGGRRGFCVLVRTKIGRSAM